MRFRVGAYTAGNGGAIEKTQGQMGPMRESGDESSFSLRRKMPHPQRSVRLAPYSAATAAGRGMLLDFLELRLEAALEHPVDTVEIEIDDRRDVERQELRDAQPADHRDAKWLAQLRARAGAERDRQRAEDRGERRHHDRPEA